MQVFPAREPSPGVAPDCESTGRIIVPYNVARLHVRDADLLSYRTARWSPSGRLIAMAGRGDESHSACAAWDDGRLQAFGMRLLGKKQAYLSDEVRDHPNRIDVYRLSPLASTLSFHPVHLYGQERVDYCLHSQRRKIVNLMRHFTLKDRYGWLGVLRSSLAFIPGLRVVARCSRNDLETRKRPPFCSHAYAYAARLHFTDLLKNRPDHDVLPAELVTSPLLNYMFTLGPPEKDAGDIGDYVPALRVAA